MPMIQAYAPAVAPAGTPKQCSLHDEAILMKAAVPHLKITGDGTVASPMLVDRLLLEALLVHLAVVDSDTAGPKVMEQGLSVAQLNQLMTAALKDIGTGGQSDLLSFTKVWPRGGLEDELVRRRGIMSSQDTPRRALVVIDTTALDAKVKGTKYDAEIPEFIPGTKREEPPETAVFDETRKRTQNISWGRAGWLGCLKER